MHRHNGSSYLHRIIKVSVNRQLYKASGIAQVVSLPYVRCSRPLCTRPLAVLYVRSLSYIHCTRPLGVLHSLHTPARCRTFTVHVRSLSYIHCTRSLARSRTFAVHARSLSYIHRIRPLAVVHARSSIAVVFLL